MGTFLMEIPRFGINNSFWLIVIYSFNSTNNGELISWQAFYSGVEDDLKIVSLLWNIKFLKTILKSINASDDALI